MDEQLDDFSSRLEQISNLLHSPEGCFHFNIEACTTRCRSGEIDFRTFRDEIREYKRGIDLLDRAIRTGILSLIALESTDWSREKIGSFVAGECRNAASPIQNRLNRSQDLIHFDREAAELLVQCLTDIAEAGKSIAADIWHEPPI